MQGESFHAIVVVLDISSSRFGSVGWIGSVCLIGDGFSGSNGVAVADAEWGRGGKIRKSSVWGR